MGICTNYQDIRFRDIDNIKKESDEIRSGTLNRINEMKRDIAILIAEYDGSECPENVNDDTKPSQTPLSESVRRIKLRSQMCV